MMPREVTSPEEDQLFHLLTMARTANNMMLEVTREIIRMYEEERKKPKMLLVTSEEYEEVTKKKKAIMDIQVQDGIKI
jgi:CRISPR/Cas system-associated endonuclease Cas3-HD